MRRILLALTLAGALAAAGNKPADEAAVRAAVDKFNASAKAGDEAALKTLLSEDLVYGHSSAKMENKAECIAAIVKTKPNFVMKDGWTVHLYGKTAIVRASAVAHNQGQQIPLAMIQVWVKDGKDWKMVARNTTRIPQT